MNLFVSLFVHLSVHPSVQLSLHRSFHLSACPSIISSMHTYICLSNLSVYWPACPSVRFSVQLSLLLSFRLSFCQFIHANIHLSLHLSVRLSVSLPSVRPSVRQSISLSTCLPVPPSAFHQIYTIFRLCLCPSLSLYVHLSFFMFVCPLCLFLNGASKVLPTRHNLMIGWALLKIFFSNNSVTRDAVR